jgi:hypothetical protein
MDDRSMADYDFLPEMDKQQDMNAGERKPTRRAPENSGRAIRERKGGPGRRRRNAQSKFWKLVIGAASLIVHGFEGILAHVLEQIPTNPIKGIGFVCVLGVLVYHEGMKAHDDLSQRLCFGCMSMLTLIALGLIVVCVRSPGNDERLRQMQEERVRAIQVKPFQYKGRSGSADIEDSRHY